MSENEFTIEQKKAIYTQNSNLLVAAAAGSGKTAVLVERIINLICNNEKPVSIDRLLVVTFTEAAAGEMKQRIGEAITKKTEKEPYNENLRKQASLLNKASISTIHSFCLEIVHKYFHLTDLDPGFKIADMTELHLLKADILEEIFEFQYSLDDNSPFLGLVESYGNGKLKDDGLSKLILDIHSFVNNIPWYPRWLDEKLDMFKLESDVDINNTPWFAIVKSSVLTALEGVSYSIEYALDVCLAPFGPYLYEEAFLSDKAMVETLISVAKAGSYSEIYEAFNFAIGNHQDLPRKTPEHEVSADFKKQAQDIRKDDIKGALAKLCKKYFSKQSALVLKEIKDTYPVLKELLLLVIIFDKEYAEGKRDRNLVDFNDLEHYCLRILLKDSSVPGALELTEAALETRERFKQVMIDEYQDSNLVQELILSSISGDNKPNRFMVGDIKQSIYRFRRANPEIFLEKYETYGVDEPNAKGGLRIDLYKNFRSRDIVLNSINFLFYQLMSENIGDIIYDDKVALYPGAVFADANGQNISTDVEVCIALAPEKKQNPNEDSVLDNLSKTETEAIMVANKINSMMKKDNPLLVYSKEKGGYKPVEYKDIVIILRTMKNTGNIFADVFKNHDIPVFADITENYFDTIEVSTVLSFLKTIDNPRQDIDLITVLHSPIYGFNSDQLLTIRQCKLNCNFYDCILEYVSLDGGVYEEATEILEKLDLFLADLKSWRDLAVYTPIFELIDQIYTDTDYYNIVGVMPNGAQRQANLIALQEKSSTYESTSYKGLFNFIKYMEKLSATNADMPNVKTSSESANCVKIITIHKSKGLEFPVVFVSNLSKGFNPQEERSNLIMHQKHGFGLVNVDVSNRVKTKTLPIQALQHKIHQEALSEEMRMLYVAMTRAKEKLILTGCVTNIEKKLSLWNRFSSYEPMVLPLHHMIKATCMLDWVCSALSRHSDWQKNDSLKAENTKLTNDQLYNHSSKFNIIIDDQRDSQNKPMDKNANPAYSKLREDCLTRNHEDFLSLLQERMSWVYPYKQMESMPTKISISEIKRIHQAEIMDNYTQPREINLFANENKLSPEFLKSDKKPSAAKTGTLIHAVMEHLDLSFDHDHSSIQDLINNLVSNNIIDLDEGKTIPINGILAFTKSPLCQRMRAAKVIKREAPFVLELTPYEVYGAEAVKHITDPILVHGIIDCYFIEGDEVVLVDYKSDKVKNIKDIKDRYALQLYLYKKALEQGLGKRVKESVLYLFDQNTTVNLN